MTFSVPDALTTAAAAVAIAGSAAAVYSWCRKHYRQSIGSRKDVARRFNQLAPGVTTRYIEERFGSPAFVRDFDVGNVKLTEQLYHTRHAWLQTITNEHKAVVRFSITVTDPRFHFQILHLTVGQLEAEIGYSRFSEIRRFAQPQGRAFKAMVRRLGYAESYWLGSSGYYQSVVLSYNDAGTGSFGCSIDQALQRNVLAFADGNLRNPQHGGTPEYEPDIPWEQQFRAQTVVNTLTILSAGFTRTRMDAELDPESSKGASTTLLGASLGPDAEYVGPLVPAPFRQRGKPLPRPPRQ